MQYVKQNTITKKGCKKKKARWHGVQYFNKGFKRTGNKPES